MYVRNRFIIYVATKINVFYFVNRFSIFLVVLLELGSKQHSQDPAASWRVFFKAQLSVIHAANLFLFYYPLD